MLKNSKTNFKVPLETIKKKKINKLIQNFKGSQVHRRCQVILIIVLFELQNLREKPI